MLLVVQWVPLRVGAIPWMLSFACGILLLLFSWAGLQHLTEGSKPTQLLLLSFICCQHSPSIATLAVSHTAIWELNMQELTLICRL